MRFSNATRRTVSILLELLAQLRERIDILGIRTSLRSGIVDLAIAFKSKDGLDASEVLREVARRMCCGLADTKEEMDVLVCTFDSDEESRHRCFPVFA